MFTHNASSYSLQTGLDLDQKLIIAAECGDIKALDELIAAGATRPEDLELEPEDDEPDVMTLLHIAAQKGRLPMVKHLLDKKMYVIKDNGWYGYTALHVAVTAGHFSIVQYFLQQSQTSITMRDYRMYTPLDCAISGGNIPMVEFIFKECPTCIENCVLPGVCLSKPMMAFLLKKGGRLEHLSYDEIASLESHTLLFNAYNLLSIADRKSKDCNELIKTLSILGESVNARRDSDRNTALHLAIIRSNVKLVAYLLNSLADINLPNSQALTPLDLVLRHSDITLRAELQILFIEQVILRLSLISVDIGKKEESKDEAISEKIKGAEESKEKQREILGMRLSMLIQSTLIIIPKLNATIQTTLILKISELLIKSNNPDYIIVAYTLLKKISNEPLTQFRHANKLMYQLLEHRTIDSLKLRQNSKLLPIDSHDYACLEELRSRIILLELQSEHLSHSGKLEPNEFESFKKINVELSNLLLEFNKKSLSTASIPSSYGLRQRRPAIRYVSVNTMDADMGCSSSSSSSSTYHYAPLNTFALPSPLINVIKSAPELRFFPVNAIKLIAEYADKTIHEQLEANSNKSSIGLNRAGGKAT